MQFREAFYVRFIDDGIVPRRTRRTIFAPRKRRIDDAALDHARGVIASIEREVFAFRANAVTEVRIAPQYMADEGFRVRVHEQLMRIEPMASQRFVRPEHAIRIHLPRSRLR